MNIKYFSMFSGISGFELGVEAYTNPDIDFTCIGQSEIDKYASAISKYHFPEVKNYGDATKIKAEELPDFQLLVGGFPCQAFSIAGKRRGFEDTRGTLFFDIARILREKKPTGVLLENVKGLLSHSKGETFETILGVLTELGYHIQWMVLNSKNFGVPQNRERVLIAGCLGGWGGQEIFSLGKGDRADEELEKSGEPVVKCLRARGQEGHSGIQLIRDLTESREEERREGPSAVCIQRNQRKEVVHKDVSGAVTQTMSGAQSPKVVIPVLTPDRVEKRQNGRRFKEDGDPMFTLTGQDKHGVLIKVNTEKGYEIAEEGDSVNYSVPTSKTRRGRVGKGIAQTLDTGALQGVVTPPEDTIPDSEVEARYTVGTSEAIIRRLTPIECERLQGFPDNWTQYGVFDGVVKGISDTQRYKCCGNAVTVNVISWVIEQMFSW